MQIPESGTECLIAGTSQSLCTHEWESVAYRLKSLLDPALTRVRSGLDGGVGNGRLKVTMPEPCSGAAFICLALLAV